MTESVCMIADVHRRTTQLVTHPKMLNQKYWRHISHIHTGIHLRWQSTPLNQSDKTATNHKSYIYSRQEAKLSLG